MANVIVDIVDPFDPRTETLRQFIDRYEQTGKDQGRFKPRIDRKTNKPRSGTGVWPGRTLLENAPGIKEFLDRPLIDLLSAETRGDPEVGYNKAIVTPAARQKTVGAGRIDDIKGAMQAIYSNSARQLLRLNIAPETIIVNPADTIVVPRGTGGQRTSSVQKQQVRINPYKVGEFQLKLEDYAKANPDKAPIARAILFGLNQGYRVDEFLGITSDNIITPPKETGRTEPTFANIVPKTSTEINGPLSSQSLALLEDQGQFLTNPDFNEGSKPVEGKGLSNLADVDTPYIWTYRNVDSKTGKVTAVPIDERDVNKVLEEVQVEGLFEEEVKGKPGVFTPVTRAVKSKDLRRINATIFEAIGNQNVDISTAAAWKGRDIPKGGSGLEGRYQAGAQGIYDTTLDTARGHFDNFMTSQYQRALIEAGRISEGTLISPYATFSNRLITGNYVLATDRAGVAINLPASPAVTQGVSSLSKEAGVTTPQGIVDVGVEKPEISDESKSKFRFFAENGMKVVAPLGIYAALEGGAMTYDKYRGEGASMAVAGAVAAGQTLYELGETPPMMAGRAALNIPTAGVAGVSDEPGFIPGRGAIETDFTRSQAVSALDEEQRKMADVQSRIDAYDAAVARQETIDEQMARIKEYDAEMARRQSEEPNEGIVVEVLPGDTPIEE